MSVLNHDVFVEFSAIIDESILLYERVKKKGYVRLTTNVGDLNIEVYADMVSGLFTINIVNELNCCAAS